MARGSKLKEEIAKKILEVFPGSFLYNGGKEIRIQGKEDSEVIQIKVTLTAAKENVYSGEDAVELGEQSVQITSTVANQQTIVQPTAEEKDNVERLMKAFGL